MLSSSGVNKMPAVKINDLNALKGGNAGSSFVNSLSEGQQSVDKIKGIIDGINSILTKVQGMKQNQTPQPQNNAPQAQHFQKETMPIQQRATIEVNEEKVSSLINQLKNSIPDFYKEKTLKEILQMGDGSEQILKTFIVQIIKETTFIKYS